MEKSICIFGDSITWGSSDWEGGGWANRIQHYMNSLNESKWQRVFVLGIPGDTSEGLVKRFSTEASVRDPGIIIFAIGINDVYSMEPNGPTRITLDEFKSNILELIKLAKNFTDKIIFINPMDVDEKLCNPRSPRQSYYSNSVINNFRQIIDQACGDNQVMAISIGDAVTIADLDDGLHPNAEGHEKMFQQVKSFLEAKKLI